MDVWESKLIEDLNIIVKLSVTKLGKIIHAIDAENQKKWLDTFKEEIHEACTLYVEEATFFVAIQYLRRSCSKLCDLLEIDVPLYDSENLTLYEEKKILEKHVKEYEEEIKGKQNRFKEMSAKQVSLCRLLEKVPMVFIEKTIPTNAELNNLSIEINKLESEWQEIENKFCEIKTNIKNTLHELDIEINEEISYILSSANNTSITKDNLQLLVNYYEKLQRQQNQEEYQQLKSLEEVINNLYDTCHIEMPERIIIQNIHTHTLNEIQEEISRLRVYWEENEKTFLLYENYNQHWMKLSKFVEESHRHKSMGSKIIPLKEMCKQIYQIEERLINNVIQYEQKHAKPFTTFGETIPDVIAKLHDSFGNYTIIEKNYKKTLSSIILEYRNVNKNSQYQFVNQEIIDHDSNSDTLSVENESAIKEENDSLRGDSPLLIEEAVMVEEPLDAQSEMIEIPFRSNNYHSQSNTTLPSTASQENNINVNINNQNTPVQVSIFLNTPSSSSTTLKIGKTKNYNQCKTEKKIPYRRMPYKNETVESIFKPKSVELIQNIITEDELK